MAKFTSIYLATKQTAIAIMKPFAFLPGLDEQLHRKPG
jgi:hypothetical protein